MDRQRTRTVVLLVDDSLTQLQWAMRALEGAGFRVHTATNGREALERARRWQPDIILSDVLMPIMDGFALCREIRRDPALTNVPLVLFTSTFVDIRDDEFALAIGATRYLLKPTNSEELVAQVREVLVTGHTGQMPAMAADSEAFLAGYSERLAAKLEQQVVALEEAKNELERRVDARTAELQHLNQQLQLELGERARIEEELRQAKEEAETANHAKNDFLSRMSHELRTPLNAILGFAQVLEMDTAPGENRESVEQILIGGRHLLELINEVLDIASIEAGRLNLSLEPVALQIVITEALTMIGSLAATHNIQLMREAAGTGPSFVLADRQRLKQVFLNLLSNAVKYNRPDGKVELAWSESTPGVVRVEVRDTGPGIAPEHLGKLFIPFERLGAERTGVEGTGIGLGLAKRLVEAMHGMIGVESIVGQGSTFWFELPLAENTVAAASSSRPEAARASQAAERVYQVLYIEDNLSNQQLMERILMHRPGLRLLTATEGGRGFELALQHRPDLILLDLHLPNISGDAVLQRLRDTPQTRNIPVVMISADATTKQIERLLAGGARAYLTKPLDIRQFLDVIDRTLQQSEHP